MEPFTRLTSKVLVLPANDIDTDQIIPARFLKVTQKAGLGDKLFFDWRYDDSGNPKPEFALNRQELRDARVLLAGDNFGCGSSREHAPWALVDWGFRAVVARSFADIFNNNALKNGLLPVVVDVDVHAELLANVRQDESAHITIDLAQQALSLPTGRTVSFAIEPFAKRCLLDGTDQLGYLLSFLDDITAFEAKQ